MLSCLSTKATSLGKVPSVIRFSPVIYTRRSIPNVNTENQSREWNCSFGCPSTLQLSFKFNQQTISNSPVPISESSTMAFWTNSSEVKLIVISKNLTGFLLRNQCDQDYKGVDTLAPSTQRNRRSHLTVPASNLTPYLYLSQHFMLARTIRQPFSIGSRGTSNSNSIERSLDPTEHNGRCLANENDRIKKTEYVFLRASIHNRISTPFKYPAIRSPKLGLWFR